MLEIWEEARINVKGRDYSYKEGGSSLKAKEKRAENVGR